MSGWQDQYCACDVATKEIPIFTQKSTSSLKVWGCPSRLREQLINSSKMILVLALVTLVLPKWYWCKKYALGFAGPCAGHPGPSNSNCRWVSLHLPGPKFEQMRVQTALWNNDLLTFTCYLKTLLTNMCQLERRRGQSSAASIPAWVVKKNSQNKVSSSRFPPTNMYIFETIKFPCTFSICSRKTRRRPRVKTKFSFMPEGQQREVAWKAKEEKLEIVLQVHMVWTISQVFPLLKSKIGGKKLSCSGARGHPLCPRYLWPACRWGRTDADAHRIWLFLCQ